MLKGKWNPFRLVDAPRQVIKRISLLLSSALPIQLSVANCQTPQLGLF